MKYFDKFVISPNEPTSTQVLWIVPNGNASVAKAFIDGKWKSLGSNPDLSQYLTTEAFQEYMNSYYNKTYIDTALKYKINKPSATGSQGQVLSLDSSGNPVWTTVSASGTLDTEMSDNSTNPVQNKVIKEYVDSHEPKIDGNYPLMSVGKAGTLEGNIEVKSAFMERIVGGSDDADVANGLAQVTEVKGKSVRFNLLTYIGDGDVSQGLTKTAINQCTVRIQGTADNKYPTINYVSEIYSVHVKEDHVYYSNVVLVAGTLPENVFVASYDNSFRGGRVAGAVIKTATADKYNAKWQLVLPDNYSELTLDMTLCLTVHDLTDIFGEGNEPTTTAEFETWLVKNVGKQPWYPWTKGTILNAGIEGIEATGFNLLNPTTGKAQIIGAYSSLYGNYYGISGTYTSLSFTDMYGRTSTITPDSDGKFELTEKGELTVTGAGNNTAVFLWWDGTQKEYKAYQKSGTYIDVTHILGKQDGTGTLESVFPNGMCGFGGSYDLLDESGATVVIGSRAYASGDEEDTDVLTDGTTTLYALSTPKFYPISSLVYDDSSYHTDNTPVTIPAKYEVDNWGIELIIPTNSGTLNSIAPCVTCKYSPDVIETLDTHSEELEDHEERIAELEDATNGLVTSTSVRAIVTLTQDEYDALATKDANTEYNIIESV